MAIEINIESQVSQTITDGVTDKAPSENAVFDALANKVDKETGKGLSEEDFTMAEKNKLAGIEAGAEVNVNADWNATTGDAEILNKPTIPDAALLVPYTGAVADVDLGTHKLTAHNLAVNHPSGSGDAATITKGGSGEALKVVKSSGSGNAASITGGVTLLDELNLTTKLADAEIASAANWNAKIGGAVAIGQVAFGTAAGVIGGDARLRKSASTLTIGANPNNGFADNAILNVIGSTDNVLFPTSHARTATINLTSHNQSGAGTGTARTNTIQTNSFGNLLFINNSITKLFISNSFDRVGILNSNPAYTLDVTGTFRNTTGAILASVSGNVLINTTTDSGAKLHVRAPGALSSDIAFRVQNSTGTADLFSVNGLGNARVQGVITGSSTEARVDLVGTANSAFTGYTLIAGSALKWDIGSIRNSGFGTAPLLIRYNNANLSVIHTSGAMLLGGTTEIASSLFTLESNTRGFLPPRMTNAQRLAIASPAIGLMVYCTDAVEGLYVNKSTGWTFII